jgi:hypothetical protein
MLKLRKHPALALAALILLPLILSAQGTVTIYGTVTDPSGAAIGGAKVTITNEATGQSRDTVSAADGNYVVPDLSVGSYRLNVTASGFKGYLQNDIHVQVDENRRVAVQMTLGGVNESVTVAADVAQVETRSSALRQVVDSARIVELPLNGRNPLQLQYLVAGSSALSDPSGGQALNNQSVSINGMRANSNNYSLDGADNQDPFFNTPSVFPNPDALEEFSLQTSNYSAELGRNAGGAMNAVTRSGGNELHGTVFEFLRNQDFDARSFFANSVSPFKRNQFGGTVGGPIRKDKTFFFGSYQGTRVNSEPGTQTPVVPTTAQRNGDFTGAKSIKDPTTGTLFPGNIIPTSRLSTTALNFLSAFVPLPNSPNNIYTFPNDSTTVDDQAVVKIDHTLTNSNHLSGRLIYERNDTNQVPNALDVPGFWAIIDYSNWNVSINDIHTFSPHLVNQFIFGFNDITRNQLPHIPEQKSLVDLGAGFIRSAPGPIAYDTEVAGYFQGFSRYLLNQYRKFLQFTDGLNWTLGSHTLKFGADVRQSICDQGQNFQTDPQVLFTANYTGLALADFMLGRENSFTQGSPNAGSPRTLEFAAFAQDDWKVSQRLTVNMGLRWDPWLPYNDNLHAISQFRPGQQSTVYPTAPPGYVFPGDTGVSSTSLHSQLNNWGPRLGFAYDLFGNGKTSLRGGYGIFYSDVRQQSLNNISSNEPFGLSLAVSQPTGGLTNPYADTGNPFPFQPPATSQARQSFKFILPLTTLTEWDPNFRDALVQQWNISLQQQVFSDWIFTLAYAGSTGNHLFIQNQLDPTVFGKTGANANAKRVYAPYYSSIVDMLSVGNSNYNSLQVSANKRFHHGLTILMNYTWSKSIDEGSNDSDAPSNPYNIRNDRAVSSFDIPHKFVGSFVWQLPGSALHNALARTLVGGWEINGIFNFQSGTPFTVTSGVDNSQSAINADRANLVGDPHLDTGRPTAQLIQKYFNTAAFTVNTVGTFGNAGRDILFGPGVENIDFGGIKTFAVKDRYKVQFRAEAFNLFNHPNFNNPNANVSAATFGTITGSGAPRVLQLALKAMF